MTKKSLLTLFLAVIVIFSLVTTSGVFAVWIYGGPVDPIYHDLTPTLGDFDYNKIYILNISSPYTATSFTEGNMVKTADTQAKVSLDLGSANNASANYNVTFYNGSDVTYYYNKTETVSSDNNNIVYEVTGITQKEAVEPNTTKKAVVTFTFKNGKAVSDTDIEALLNFLFVIDKDSINIVVARNILTKFLEILNNQAAPNSYQTLDTAMDNRTGSNKASDVTFIGNVVGSNSADTQALVGLFGDELNSMDLDGDNVPESITIMIKRHNLDNNDATGESYSYTTSNWWGGGQETHTVNGAEFTIYITAKDLDNYNRGNDVEVYAATFTKLPGATAWTELVGLTKGTAKTNNYTSGDYWGDANSFNTTTWKSSTGETMETLVTRALKNN